MEGVRMMYQEAEKLDTRIVERLAQPLINFLYTTFGIHHFMTAKILVLLSASVVAYITFLVFPVEIQTYAFPSMLLLFWACIVAYAHILREESESEVGTKGSFSKLEWILGRCVLLVVLTIVAATITPVYYSGQPWQFYVHTLLCLVILSLVSALYVAACDWPQGKSQRQLAYQQ